MASWNVTVEDSSPYITYSPANAWTDGASSQAASYSGSSFRTTAVRGATASFDFRGTGIWLFGARTSTYGDFTISVDGKAVTQGNAASPQATFKTLLGGVGGLENGKHTVVLTNVGSGVDLDMIMFQAEAGSAGATVTPTMVDDMNSSITYGPSPSDWSFAQSPSHHDGTLHFSDVGGAQATYTFTGDAVAVYGTVSSDHGPMQVSIDGKTEQVVATSPGSIFLHAQTLVYWADNLGSGSHKMTITGNPSLSGQRRTGKFVDIDAIQSFQISGGLPAVANPTSNGNQGVSDINTNITEASTGASAEKDVARASSGRLYTGTFVGIAVGGAVAFLAILGLLFFLYCCRRSRRPRKQTMNQPKTPALPIQFANGLSPVDEEKGQISLPAVLPSDPLIYGSSFPTQRNGPYSLSNDSRSSFSARSTTSQRSTAPLIATDPSFYGPDRSVDAPAIRMPQPLPASFRTGTPSRVGQLERTPSGDSNRSMMQRKPSQDLSPSLRPVALTPELRPNNGPNVNTSSGRDQTNVPTRPAVRPATLMLSPLEGPVQPFQRPLPKVPLISKPTRPSRPSSPRLSDVDLVDPQRRAPAGANRDTIGIVDLYSSNR